MTLSTRIAICLATTTFLGCNGADVSSPGLIDPNTAAMAAVSPNTIFGLVGSNATDLPAVKITRKADATPVSGVSVVFTVAGSQSSTFTTTTGNDGIARMGSLTLDKMPGQYIVFANADGFLPVTFVTLAFNHTPIAVYDLQTEGGLPLPVTYGSGSFSNTTTGGHYVLLDDGSYVYGYEENGRPGFSPVQRFIRVDPQTVNFYSVGSDAPVPPGFPNPGYLFSQGTVTGNTLTVKYADSFDFPDDLYVLRH